MADEKRVLTVEIRRDRVIAPMLRAIQQSLEVVSICVDAIEARDLSQPLPSLSPVMEIKFEKDPRTADQRRSDYLAWVLTRGFQELMRGARSSLEEALFYIAVTARMRTNETPTTWGGFWDEFGPVRSKAARLKFPALIAEVNKGLTAPLHFEEQFKSMQKVRNCLEHRNGRVGSEDIDPKTGLLTLAMPRMKFYYLKGEEEIELVLGSRIEADVTLHLRQVIDRREFKVGEHLRFTADEFSRAAWGCWAFSQDLMSKLPDGMPTTPAPL